MINDRDYMRPAQRPPFKWGNLTAVNAIIAATVGVFLLDFILGGWVRGLNLSDWMALSQRALGQGKFWTLLSYNLLHEGFWHIFFNMLLLYFMGPMVEKMLGRARFVLLYLLCVLGGGLLWLAVNWMQGHSPSLVGASAGVIGVMAYFCATWVDRPVTFLFMFVIPVRMRPKTILALVAGAELFGFLFLEVAPNRDSAIAYSAHLGGMATALLFSYFLNGRIFPYSRAAQGRSGGGFFERFKKKKRLKAEDIAFNVAIGSREDLRAEVNRILDKISSDGFASLTEAEKETLKRAKDRL